MHWHLLAADILLTFHLFLVLNFICNSILRAERQDAYFKHDGTEMIGFFGCLIAKFDQPDYVYFKQNLFGWTLVQLGKRQFV